MEYYYCGFFPSKKNFKEFFYFNLLTQAKLHLEELI